MSDPKIKEIRRTTDVNEANKYLAAGWVLLATATGQDEMNYPLTVYSLGRPAESQDPADKG
ncbi:hypothetical protein [Aquabacterium parvum]|jgi:hypothetical protein|uniref:hypothetical protein n=1 Tax=Aquabacterium parvum TaxID=70584 RepID=UPI000718B002|nr:hypothetical protein [Aquabacterium parvum]